MSYVENRKIHDADSHVMEMPDKILEFMSKKHLDEFKPYVHKKDLAWVSKMEALHDDPEYRSGAEAEIMLRRGHAALGGLSQRRPSSYARLPRFRESTGVHLRCA